MNNDYLGTFSGQSPPQTGDTNFVTEAKAQLLRSGEIPSLEFRELTVAQMSQVLQLAQKLKEEKCKSAKTLTSI
jgi:hypothetical protein